MNSKQNIQLQIACELLRQNLKKAQQNVDVSKRWTEFALRGSVQSRKASKTLVRR